MAFLGTKEFKYFSWASSAKDKPKRCFGDTERFRQDLDRCRIGCAVNSGNPDANYERTSVLTAYRVAVGSGP
jgi:hypothetical protein